MNKVAVYLPFALGLAIIAALWGHDQGSAILVASNGAVLRSFGDLCGLVGSYCALWQLILMSRLPLFEGPVGREQLIRFHKLNGYAVLTLLIMHATLVTEGFALQNRDSYVAQYLTQFLSFPDVWRANIALALLVFIVGLSVSIVRRRLKYETWYYVHLFTYVAIVIAFGHQLANGPDFLGHPLARLYWWALYLTAFSLIGWFKWFRPLYRFAYYRWRVVTVTRATDESVSITIGGRHLERFNFTAGQFAVWRFVAPGLWWQTHPFSFSHEPNGTSLRITVKAIGDFTSLLQRLPVGTPVLLDGPSGRFTLPARRSQRLIFIAGGIGITPLRAMIGAASPDLQIQLIYVASTAHDMALRDELDELMAAPARIVSYVTTTTIGRLDLSALGKLVGKARDQDIYLCGPEAMMDATHALLVELGFDEAVIHSEDFRY